MRPRNFFIFSLVLIFVFALAFFPACNKKEIESLSQQNQSLQAKNEDLQKELTDKMSQWEKEKKELQSQIPEASEVLKGESHWSIAYDFLTQKKSISDETARKILYQTPLFSQVWEGFKIWNYYYNNVFGSFLTQGNAVVSPRTLMRVEKKEKTEEKQALEQEITALEKQNEELKKDISELKNESKGLQSQIASLSSEKAGLQSQLQSLDSRLNSMYYLVDTKDNLKASGKIKGTFLGLGGIRIDEVTFSDFKNRLDLRSSTLIELRAADFKIPKIKKVELLPQYLQENLDYRLEISGDGQQARVQILEKEKFALARVIILID